MRIRSYLPFLRDYAGGLFGSFFNRASPNTIGQEELGQGITPSFPSGGWEDAMADVLNGSRLGNRLNSALVAEVNRQIRQAWGGGRRVSVSTYESTRSREAESHFRLSRSQQSVEMLRALRVGNRNA